MTGTAAEATPLRGEPSRPAESGRRRLTTEFAKRHPGGRRKSHQSGATNAWRIILGSARGG